MLYQRKSNSMLRFYKIRDMIKKTCILLIFLTGLSSIARSEPSLEELEAKEFLNTANTNFLDNITKLKAFVLRTRIIQGFPINDLKNEILFSSYPNAGRLKTFVYESFESEDVKRQMQILNRWGLFALSRADYINATSIINDIRNYHFARTVCVHNSIGECTDFNLLSMLDLSYQSNSPDEMKYYWKVGRNATESVTNIVNVRGFAEYFRAAAKLNQHDYASQTWYEEYDDGNLIDELEELMDQLRPFYVQLHAFIRSKLKIKYPKLLFEIDTIPQHLINELMYQTKTQSLELYYLPHPEYNPLYFDSLLIVKNNTFIDNVNAADDFFQSMGMNGLTQEYFNTHTRVRTSRITSRECKTEFFDFDYDVTLRYCAKSDFKSLYKMHGDLALIQYALHKGKLPVGLSKESCPGFGKGIAEAAKLSAINFEYLEKIGFPKDYKFKDEARLNLLIYMALETLFPIVEYFVEEKLWINILEGKIEPREYNCFYWLLMKDYAGLEPPQYRTDVHFDVNPTFYDILEERPVAKIFAKFFGHHLFQILCEMDAETEPEDTFLAQCNWYGNKNIGQRLSEIMSIGSKKPWRDILQMLGGKRKLSAAGLIKFFAPLRKWLIQENKKNRVDIGWISLLKCDQVSSYYDEDLFQ